jgi:hypothetical protein
MTLEGVARRTAEFLFLTVVGPAAAAGWIIGVHPTQPMIGRVPTCSIPQETQR